MKKLVSLSTFLVIYFNSFSQEGLIIENSTSINIISEETSLIDSSLKVLKTNPTIQPLDTGILLIEKNENFDLLLQEYLEQKKVSGYKIQLFAGNKRIDALKTKVDFMKLYPEFIPEIIYQQPNYKVRLGNFRNRLEANKELQLYKIDFPSAFIIKDHIKLETKN